ncbi:MAG: GNAT family N-acetyltransferase [Burkholderiaceae bacterium]|nr:GNAT family N-acetyltransferase [Burkholderiaceae bacterium]
MDAVFRIASAQDSNELLALFDREFIASRGRTTSLRRRYPSTYDDASASGWYLARSADGALAAGLATRAFSMHDGGKILRGAMLGAVCTDAPYRRRGIGGALLQWCAGQLREAGIEFAVLWSGQPDFYRKLGWRQAPGGVLGRAAGSTGDAAHEVDLMPAAACDAQFLETIRARHLATRVLRDPRDYAQLPIPADAVDLLLWREAGKGAYALVGRAGSEAIVYEMAGAKQGFPALWQTVLAGHTNILVNDCRGSDSFSWLSEHARIHWEDKPLALWLPLAGDAVCTGLDPARIPYFDRI